jgi:hypothetical protein
VSTLLDIKNMVADQTGAGNGSTSVPKRDRIINSARRDFYSAHQWSFLKKSTTISITAQLGTLPTDFNAKFSPIAVYTYTGATKYLYDKVAWDDVNMYPQDAYVYSVDAGNGQIKINQTAVSSITFDYTHLPADKAIDTSDDTDTEIAPDISPIAKLAGSMWWLSSERDDLKFQIFRDDYQAMLVQAIRTDGGNTGVKTLYPQFTDIGRGYRGRWW